MFVAHCSRRRRVAVLIIGAVLVGASLSWLAGVVRAEDPHPRPTVSANLWPGFNLIGWSGDETPVAEVFTALGPQAQALFAWDPVDGRYRVARRDASAFLNDLDQVRRGQGLWILVRGDEPVPREQPVTGEPNTVALLSGLNLVTWLGRDGLRVEDAVAPLGGSLRALFGFDAGLQLFRTFAPALPAADGRLDVLRYGEAYWLQMNAAAIWEQPPPAVRLASHLFVPVGARRSSAGLGELLEVIPLTEPVAVRVEGDSLQAVAHGVVCLRFAYREFPHDPIPPENRIQTLCLIVFDETGDCSGEMSLQLDLLQFVQPAAQPPPDANLLESGAGRLYAACRTAAGAYRLQQPTLPLPALYFTMVDALGGGAYSLGDDEFALQRAGAVTAFSGGELRPPWIVQIGHEVRELALDPAQGLLFNDEDCALSPGCSPSSDLVQSGDIVQVSLGATQALFDDTLAAMSVAQRDRFFRDRVEIGWDRLGSINPDAAHRAFARLVALEIMGRLLPLWDARYGLRDKEVIVAYRQFWYADDALPHLCFPDPAEAADCAAIEAAIDRRERTQVAAWRDAGYRLWRAVTLDYREGGVLVPLEERRPHWSAFEGLVVGFAPNYSVAIPDVPAVLAQALRQLAADIGPETPVVLHQFGISFAAQTGGPLCEADICAFDFRGTYEQGEAVLMEALGSLSPQQFRGFGVALFEGAHFDIRTPYEDFPFFSLNRVGETGYNQPLLNIWRAQ